MTKSVSNIAVSSSKVFCNISQADAYICLIHIYVYSDLSLIYIIDNDSIDTLAEIFVGPNIAYVHNLANPSFGGVYNIAIAQSAQASILYHPILKADISFDQDVLAPMLSFMKLPRDVVHTMSSVGNSDDTLQRLCKLVPTPADLRSRLFSRQLQVLHGRSLPRIWSATFKLQLKSLRRSMSIVPGGHRDRYGRGYCSPRPRLNMNRYREITPRMRTLTKTGRAYPRQDGRPTGSEACVQLCCYCIGHQPAKRGSFFLNGTNQGCTSRDVVKKRFH